MSSSRTDNPFYRIEKGPFEAEVEETAGSLERAKAALTLAGLQRRRAEELLAKAPGTIVARDQAVAEEEQAKGAIMIDEANLRTAKSISVTPRSRRRSSARSAALISLRAMWSVLRADR